jgi:NAD(P)-dependent dehydrogenase (short-subunit alcohol dehydrogenase family)
LTTTLDLADPLAAFRLDGAVAVVTGGGNGIGRAIALGMARVGAHVAILDREAEAGVRVAAEIAAAGGSGEAHHVDVAEEPAVDRAIAGLGERRGRLDVLVNNAGISIRRPAVELSLAEWEAVIGVNTSAAFLCARAAARLMLPRGAGSIINIASIMGFSGGLYPNVAYQSSKGALVNMTRALAVEWAKGGIRVNGIAPTWVRTRLIAPLLQRPEALAELERAMPMGRIAEPEDMVGAALYLASRASAMVTGHTIAVDGGYLAW